MTGDKRQKAKDHLPFTIYHLPFTLAAGAILSLVTMAFFWQIIFTETAWMPAGGGDLLPFLYPNYHFAAQSLQNGVIPLWNPHLYSGIPFAADAQSGLFYPPNLLVFLLSPNLSIETLEYLAVFHFWLAGFGMFLFLQHSPLARKLHLHPIAAITGAIAFEFSDLFIVHFGNLNMIAVAAWLPLVMLAFQNAVHPPPTPPVNEGRACPALPDIEGGRSEWLPILLRKMTIEKRQGDGEQSPGLCDS